MADITWSDVTGFAPQLSAITDTGVQELIVGVANESLEPCAFGGDDAFRYRFARLLLAAHIATIQLLRGDAGKVASENVSKESLALSYASGTGDSAYSITDYGSQLEEMMRASPSRLPIVV